MLKITMPIAAALALSIVATASTAADKPMMIDESGVLSCVQCCALSVGGVTDIDRENWNRNPVAEACFDGCSRAFRAAQKAKSKSN